MDSLLLFGGTDLKLTKFLEKMGYDLTICGESNPAAEVLETKLPDLVVVDARMEMDTVELCRFLSKHEHTKQVPLVYLCKDEIDAKRVSDLPKVSTIQMPYKVGILASKIATELRLRKIAGADETTASLGEINARLRELNDCFTKQLKEARDIQFDVVPKSLPYDERFDMCAAYEPLEDVGGDWYYAQQLPNGKVSVQIADVTGHGLSAAFIACMTKLALMAAAKEAPCELLTEMNRLMSTCIPSGKFVTMFTYLYDPETGALSYARAGHPPALLLKRSEGVVKQLTGEGFAVGFFEDSEYTMETEQLEIGDILMVYTDVLPESQNMSGQTYDYDRMSEVLRQSDPTATSADILRAILDDFDEFRDGRILKDDLTAIVIKRLK